jgi:hypothetical protein
MQKIMAAILLHWQLQAILDIAFTSALAFLKLGEFECFEYKGD